MRYEKGNRKIYLNQERIPINNATPIEENCEIDVAESCYHNINNKYKNNYISDKIDKTKTDCEADIEIFTIELKTELGIEN